MDRTDKREEVVMEPQEDLDWEVDEDTDLHSAGSVLSTAQSYCYVATAQRATAVTASVVAQFIGPHERNLIVAKTSCIEVYTIGPQGLDLSMEIPIYGTITALKTVRPKSQSQDWLFVMTEKYDFCLVSFENNQNDAITSNSTIVNSGTGGKLITRERGNLKSRVGNPSEFGHLVAVDPGLRMILVHMYEGMIKVIPMDPVTGRLMEVFDMRLSDLSVLAIEFAHCEPVVPRTGAGATASAAPVLLVLHENRFSNQQHEYRLLSYEVSLTKKALSQPYVIASGPSQDSALISVLRDPIGGVILFSSSLISYHRQLRPQPENGITATPVEYRMPAKFMLKSTAPIDNERFLVSDCIGQLFVFAMGVTAGGVMSLDLEFLGITAVPSSMSYLDNAFVFVGSCDSDSQLIKLRTERNTETGYYLDVVDENLGLSPILDFCVIDMENSGQPEIVACCGNFNSGSLRVIRSGVGLLEIANVDIPSIVNVFSLKKSFDASCHSILCLTFVESTHMFHFVDEDLEQIVNIPDTITSHNSIYFGNAKKGHHYIQVTRTSVNLIVIDTWSIVATWEPPNTAAITCVCCDETEIVVCHSGNQVTCFTVENGRIKMNENRIFENEISALSLCTISESTVGGMSPLKVCAIAFWNEVNIAVIEVSSLKSISSTRVDGDLCPRSILMKPLDDVIYLLVTIGDGTVFTFHYDAQERLFRNRKTLRIGSGPVFLQHVALSYTDAVLACSELPTLIYSAESSLQFSSLNVKDMQEVKCIAPFHSDVFPSAIAVVTPGGLSIGTVDRMQKLHVRKLLLGETASRIAHQPSTRSLGIITTHTQLDETKSLKEIGYVRIINDQTHEVICDWQLRPNKMEMGCSIASIRFKDDPEDYFVVGTAFLATLLDGDQDIKDGAILLFKLDLQSKRLELVFELYVSGDPRVMNPFSGKLLTAIGSNVVLYEWVDAGDGRRKLERIALYHGELKIVSLETRGNFIAIAFICRSVVLLQFHSQTNTFEHFAHDTIFREITDLTFADEQTVLIGDADYNFVSMRKQKPADLMQLACDPTAGNQQEYMIPIGQMHLGDQINRIRPGALRASMTNHSPVLSSFLFATRSGSIGVVCTISEHVYKMLDKLQNNMRNAHRNQTFGGLDHAKWRAFHSRMKRSDSFGVIDGDFVEKFLELTETQQLDVLLGKNGGVSFEDESSFALVKKYVEDLSRCR